MIIVQLTKGKYYIPYTIEKNGTIFEVMSYLLLNNVWKLYSLPLSFISNQESYFISRIWKNLCKIPEINSNLSTSFHLEIDW